MFQHKARVTTPIPPSPMSVLCAALFTVVLPVRAHAADVAVMFSNVQSQSGDLALALCKEPNFMGDCAVVRRIPAEEGETHVILRDVPPGRYAVMAYHDEDASGALERNFIGIPEEGVAFSNDAKGSFGPPAFTDAAFHVRGDGVTCVRATMRY